MKNLERKLPPPIVFIALGLIIKFIGDEFGNLSLQVPLAPIVLCICLIVSMLIGFAGVYEFRKANTTINPINVEQASMVVDSGIFAHTRNPMYLSMFILLFGFAYWQQNILSMLIAFSFVLYINRFQIEPEENALEGLFGATYLDYKQRVRRWL
ncbi:isoprenylcysteine carboxylmethyltransferase family protein [Vibrio pectenicida]|uniref:Isoprenylcysteine carboxylmethyltransferase family protein n=1 Tax=Vibrio pectenicida TaxID=62763 RepID=A0A7Y4A3J4_9VIBR|nr:isoprenylcysteine carboxylmethyltransferase family protein [Vibrio pectenicida]NOH73214.1 isoprenylcysteine carboxylmethyltransferase family protein [Vibrio pectenicida]